MQTHLWDTRQPNGTYLGHASVRGTYWYLQTTPQLLRDVAGAAEAWMNGEPQ
jgi:integrase/recombinase XerD